MTTHAAHSKKAGSAKGNKPMPGKPGFKPFPSKDKSFPPKKKR